MPILRLLKNTEPILLAFSGAEGEAMKDLDVDVVAKVAEDIFFSFWLQFLKFFL